ncbi:MAG: flagellar basal body rod protein FlgB [Xanthomonadaceae bacterium]|nr:flagellar basal body rod protein FlgB [Xanthomonadaceae bacterium]
MGNGIFDNTIGALNTSLNLRQMNQNVISSNIANADTPGFKSKAMDFENAMRTAMGIGDQLKMQASNPNHIIPQEQDPIHPEIFDDPNGVESLDGNTVERSAEMAKLSENQLLYDASIEMLKKKLGMLKYAINEGGGNR